jgi:hypothetical protein
VDANLSESHDSRSIKEVHNVFGIPLRESLAQCGRGVRKPAHLKQLSSSTSFEDVESPGLMLTLCRGDTLLGDLEGFIEAIQNGQDIAQPLRSEKTSPLHDAYVLGGQSRIQGTYLSIPTSLADEIEGGRK